MTTRQFESMKEQGRLSDSCTLVEDHVLDMPNRIRKEMGDQKYFVCFNNESGKWEIHYDGKARDTLEVTLPFTALDQRAIDYLFQTRSVNAKTIVRQTIERNARLKQENRRRDAETVQAIARDAFRFKDHHPGKSLDPNEVQAAMSGIVKGGGA